MLGRRLLVLTLAIGLPVAGALAAKAAGYTHGASELATAPFTIDDLDGLRATLLLTDEDIGWLRRSRAVLEPHADEILDTWYGFVGANPHLLYYFHDAAGAADGEYLARVRARFRQWILDTADANYDQAWLDYQYEIGRRHHRVSKNVTDGVTGPNHIPFRYVVALTYPVTATLKPFLERGGASPEDVNAMHQAWLKAVLLQVILWSHPYIIDGDF
ncbi:MAG: protoglobin domain-containing protein [Pseudomonadota bacterium]